MRNGKEQFYPRNSLCVMIEKPWSRSSRAYKYNISLQEDVLQNKQNGQNIHQRRNLLALTANDMQNNIGDDTPCDALRDGVEQRHCQDTQVGGNSGQQVVIIELDFGDGAEHQEANQDQGRSGGKGRNGNEDGSQQRGQQEQDACGQGGQAGTAAVSDTGCGLDEGGDGGSAQNRTTGGADSVSHQNGLDAGQAAFFIQQVCLGGNADDGAQGIKDIHEQECKDHNNKVNDADGGPVNIEALTQGVAQRAEIGHAQGGIQAVITQFKIGNIQTDSLAEHTQNPGSQYADEDGTSDLLDVQHSGQHQANDCQQCADAGGTEVGGKVSQLNESRAAHADACVLQTDEGDKQADTNGNSTFQGQGNGIKDGFTDIGQGHDDEDDAFYKDSQQCYLPTIAHAEDYGVCQVCIQTHTGGQDEGHIGHEGHADSSDEGGQGGCQKNSCGIHACSRQDAGVNSQDIRHGHKGGNTGHDFCFYVCFSFRELKKLFKHFYYLLSNGLWAKAIL